MSIRLPRPFTCLGAAVASILLLGACLPTAQAKEKSIIDFTLYHREADGTISKPYEYAWGDWGSRVQNFRDKGTLIVAPSCNGGLGENNTPADFEGCQYMELTYVIGNGNQATTFSFYLEDKDGTKQAWMIPLTDKPRGRDLVERMELAKPSYVEAPGSTPGLNPKKIKVWQVRGDNSAPRIELLLVRLVQAK